MNNIPLSIAPFLMEPVNDICHQGTKQRKKSAARLVCNELYAAVFMQSQMLMVKQLRVVTGEVMSEPDVPYPKKPMEPYRGVPPKTSSPPVWSPDHPPNIIPVKK